MLYHFFYPLSKSITFLNVFKYITFRTIYATITALVISFLVGPWLIRKLESLQIGQTIRDNGPERHLKKAGTPTMGGIMILSAIIIATIFWADLTNKYILLVLFITVSYGIIGFIDDYKKLIKKNSAGLRGKQKLYLQILFATIVAVILYILPNFSETLTIPFFKKTTPDLGLFYIPFAVFVIVGASNAVNLTDGLDGLAIGPVVIAIGTYLLFSYLAGNVKIANYLQIPYVSGAGELTVFCGAVVGAGIGFLWFNAYPAQIFMGDVGSLSLGGALGTVAVITKQEILLVIAGGLFVVEALSVIFQVASFQMRGKRLFKMAPIHHHFELKGWPEPKIIVRFWIISVLLALLAISTLKLR